MNENPRHLAALTAVIAQQTSVVAEHSAKLAELMDYLKAEREQERRNQELLHCVQLSVMGSAAEGMTALGEVLRNRKRG